MALQDYENGLLRIGHSAVIHLVDPNPITPLAPWCKPHGTRAALVPANEAKEANCGRCRRKQNAGTDANKIKRRA